MQVIVVGVEVGVEVLIGTVVGVKVNVELLARIAVGVKVGVREEMTGVGVAVKPIGNVVNLPQEVNRISGRINSDKITTKARNLIGHLGQLNFSDL